MSNNNFPTPSQEQLDLLRQQNQYQYEIAKKNIETTFENNKLLAEHWYRISKLTYLFIGAVILLIALFCGFAIYMGKDAIAMEIVKTLVLLGAGSGAGYYYGYAKGKEQKNK